MKNRLIIILLLFIALFFIKVGFVHADTCLCTDGEMYYDITCSGCDNWCSTNGHGNEDKCATTKSTELPKPIGDVTIPELIGKIINGVLGVVGSLALVIFIYGGFVWMTAAGNTERITKGKNILIWATLGLVVIFASYAIVHFIIFEGINPTGG